MLQLTPYLCARTCTACAGMWSAWHPGSVTWVCRGWLACSLLLRSWRSLHLHTLPLPLCHVQDYTLAQVCSAAACGRCFPGWRGCQAVLLTSELAGSPAAELCSLRRLRATQTPHAITLHPTTSTTLQYKPDTFEALAHRETVDKLVRFFGYSPRLYDLRFDYRYMMRGLVIDKRRGNMLKVLVRCVCCGCGWFDYRCMMLGLVID